MYPVGMPDIVDFLRVAEWPTLRFGLRTWAPGASDSCGSVSLTGGSLVSDTAWNYRTGPVPVLVLLEKLIAAGWRMLPAKQRPPPDHTLKQGPGHLVMNNSGACASRSYLQCLVCLSDILTDIFPALPTGQSVLYYTAVLNAKSPEAILPGQPVKYYRCALASSTTILDTPGDDEAAAPGEKPRQHADTDDEWMTDFWGGSEAHLAQPGQRKAPQKRKARDDFGDALLGTNKKTAAALLAGMAPPPAPPTVAYTPGQPASSSAAPPAAHEDPQGAAPPPTGHPPSFCCVVSFRCWFLFA